MSRYTESLKERAQAKINLRLAVRGRRADGYHLLEMINLPLALSDYVDIRRSDGSEMRSCELILEGNNDYVPGGIVENSCLKAYDSFSESFSFSGQFEIRLQKFIPAGAGLGGASSDAAAVLRGLGKLFAEVNSLEYSELLPDLRKLALSIGADVPFFLKQEAALVSGVGQFVESLDPPALEGVSVLLLFPRLHLSTPEVYSKLREQRPVIQKQSSKPLRAEGLDLSFRSLCEYIHNDLFEAASTVEPKLFHLHSQLLEHCPERQLGFSGSGSTFFVLCPDSNSCSELASKLRSAELEQSFEIISTRVLDKRLSQ